MRRVAPALAAVILLAAMPAAAQEGRYYVGTALGYNMPSDASISGGAISNSIELEGDWVGSLSAGWLAWGTPGAGGLRLDLEGGYRNNNADSISGRSANGEVGVLSLLGNAFWDIDLDTWLTPYLGGGLGYARVNYDGVGPIGGTSIDEEDFSFAWQVGGGLAVDIKDGLQATFDYRYLTVPDLSYAAGANTVSTSYESHAVMAGLRFRIGTPVRGWNGRANPMPAEGTRDTEKARANQPPRAPIAAAPANPAPGSLPAARLPEQPIAALGAPRNGVVVASLPPAARRYVLFFEPNSVELSPVSQQIVRKLAETARNRAQLVETVAYDDATRRSGDSFPLATRRAQAVRDALVAAGFPSDRVAVEAREEVAELSKIGGAPTAALPGRRVELTVR
ncbi:MAG: outer membrane beta-barrel protein [Alphaproteobacteria bacterium]